MWNLDNFLPKDVIGRPPCTYVINLDRAPGRMAAMAAQLEDLTWPFERVSAVDGWRLAADEIRDIAPKPWSRYQARAINPGEIGCLASHRAAWRRLILSDKPWGLVLEDDAILGASSISAVEVFNRQEVFDVVKLEGITVKPHKSRGAKIIGGPPDIYLMETLSAGAAAYFVTRQGAGKLLAITRSMNREADFYIRQYGLTDLMVGEFRPFLVSQNREVSFIGGSRYRETRVSVADRLIRVGYRMCASVMRRWRYRRLLGDRPAGRVTIEGSSSELFGREM